MAFPTSPTNGQQANINGITYTYSSALTAWTVSTSVSNTFVSINVSANVNSGNVLATGLASVTGNITGGNLSGTSIVGTLTTAAQTNITSVGTLGSLTVTADTTSGNLLTGGLISATGNITGGNILGGANVNATTHTGTTVLVTANVTGGNILTGGLISATGNIAGGNVIATTGLTAGTLSLTGNTISSTDSIITIDPASAGSSGAVFIQGNLSVTGNVTYINSNNVTTNDLTINMANNAATAAAANGGGIEVGPAGAQYASITYNSTGNIWVVSNGANVSGAASITGNVTGGNILTGGLISAAGNISANNATFTSNQTLSYGTANGVVYLDSNKVATSGAALVFDGTNLGLSTSGLTLGSLLQLGRVFSFAQDINSGYMGAGWIGGTGPNYAVTGNYAVRQYFDSALGTIVWQTAGTGTAGAAVTFGTKMTLDNGGNFGIGTTSPSTGKFSDASYAFLIQSASTSTGTNIFASNSDNSKYIGLWSGHSGAESAVGVKSGTALTFGAWAAINGAGGFSEWGRFDSSGNLGIGTTSPSSRLEIIGVNPKLTINANDIVNGRNATLSLISGTSADPSSTCQIMYGASNSTSAGTLTFVEGDGTERMRITLNGDVGIGGTPANTAGYTTLTLNNATNGGLIALSTGGVQKGGLFNAGNDVYLDCNNAAGQLLIRNTSTGATSTFLPSGLLQIPAAYTVTTGSAANLFIDAAGGFYRSTSSLKYKTDVKNTTHGLTEVMQLRAVTYKGTGEFDGETVFGGLIAEEVHEVGLTEFVQYAEDGSPDALAYGNMVSLCIKAIQEQQALITQLTARITALEGA